MELYKMLNYNKEDERVEYQKKPTLMKSKEQ